MPDTARLIREALRAEGLIRLPTLYVTPDEAEAIYRIASKHRATVRRVRKHYSTGDQ